jgi:hypothetical protein
MRGRAGTKIKLLSLKPTPKYRRQNKLDKQKMERLVLKNFKAIILYTFR